VVVLLSHKMDLTGNFFHLTACSFDDGGSVTILLPTFNVSVHLVIATLLFLCLGAQAAYSWLKFRLVNKLQSTSFPNSMFLDTMLSELAPSPYTAAPANLVEIAHSGDFSQEPDV
jgi:hypothetical protein